MANPIVDALWLLDAENDNHWTENDLARLDTVKMLAKGALPSLTRDALEAAAPGFNRSSYRAAIAARAAGTAPPQPQGATNVPTPPTTGNGTFGVDGNAGSPQPPKQPQVEAGPTSGAAQIQALAEEIRLSDEAVLQQQRLLEEVKAKLADLQKQNAILVERHDQLIRENPGENPIQAYLKKQLEIAHQKAAGIQRLREAGIDHKMIRDLLPGSKLDQVRANRRKPLGG